MAQTCSWLPSDMTKYQPRPLLGIQKQMKSLQQQQQDHRIDASHSASRLVFDELGNIYVETANGTRIQPQGPTWGYSTLAPKGYYFRATLDFNGVFTQ
ncbi:hypothetical protein JHK87_002403 [Glycine soja]|nr:hypothetical protein JHK87_002403 [Glycine soja]